MNDNVTVYHLLIPVRSELSGNLKPHPTCDRCQPRFDEVSQPGTPDFTWLSIVKGQKNEHLSNGKPEMMYKACESKWDYKSFTGSYGNRLQVEYA